MNCKKLVKAIQQTAAYYLLVSVVQASQAIQEAGSRQQQLAAHLFNSLLEEDSRMLCENIACETNISTVSVFRILM
jgi:hypothetical protein